MPYTIGLTGGIASGKTTVANLFQQHYNIDIVDADVVAREVVQPGTIGLEKIVKHFGKSVLKANGELDREVLRSLIFTDKNEKAWLNNLLHPIIRHKMKQDLDKITTPYALLVVPLLVENQLQSMTDRILVVDVSTEVQIERTMKRDNVSKGQVESILSAQADRVERLTFADDIIQNDHGNDELLAQISKLHQHYMTLCQDRKKNPSKGDDKVAE